MGKEKSKGYEEKRLPENQELRSVIDELLFLLEKGERKDINHFLDDWDEKAYPIEKVWDTETGERIRKILSERGITSKNFMNETFHLEYSEKEGKKNTKETVSKLTKKQRKKLEKIFK